MAERDSGPRRAMPKASGPRGLWRPGSPLWAVVLALAAVGGVFGAVWISDDFDPWRFPITAFVGVPAFAGYVLLSWIAPARWHTTRHLWGWTVAVILLAFSPGVLALTNAATAHGPAVKRTMEAGHRIVTRDVRRGGFGVLFKSRW